ncbi:enoyl-CoA hydratase/isomerase family protein [Amycolatopsis pithecellobii]|uniref:1,4-dihydroxy-6-naphthoate synthase n=1 Tax=Amycolatopsis pithecellobii TaxID=664692 RepID=A0A6N7YSP8_9PSEU|nr:enoyl-CoA hydratase/isomerase family protein [Amycolatopsis pithecellobii]MTD56055.1 1,4-dihydroxy-6-naphthoate synthase [Amycolatopsis pithecellobii]
MARVAGLAGVAHQSFDTVRYERDGWVATITIDRERTLNSFCLRLFEEIQDALRIAERDDAVAVVVLTGAGERAFCSGADIREHWELCQRPRDYLKWIREFVAMQTALMRCPKPTIARLNGLVLGGGNELNMACDLAIAADDVIIQQAEPARGSVSGIGVTQWLPLAVGDRRAREAIFLCEPISATQAVEWGMINHAVPRAELDTAVAAMAGKLADKFPEALRYAKVQVNALREQVWSATAPHAAEWLAIHAGSPEAHEGMRAFLDKREPDRIGLRERAVRDESPEFADGPPVGECPECGARQLPERHAFCGHCGTKL